MQLRLGQSMRQLTHRMMVCRDARVRACREMILQIRQLKLLAWEHFAFARVWGFRQQELGCLRWRYYLHAIGNSFFVSTPLMVKLVALSFVVLGSDGMATASSLFAALALIDKALQALNALPLLMSDLTAAAVALKRLGRCLTPAELLTVCERFDETNAVHATRCLEKTRVHLQSPQMNSSSSQNVSNARNVCLCMVCAEHLPVINCRNAVFSWRRPTKHEYASLRNFGVPKSEGKLSVSEDSQRYDGAEPQHCRKTGNVSGTAHQLETPKEQAPTPAPGTSTYDSYLLRNSSLVLRDVNIAVSAGGLHLVLGRSGSGKSSFFNAILGEMFLIAGEAYVNLPSPKHFDFAAEVQSDTGGVAQQLNPVLVPVQQTHRATDREGTHFLESCRQGPAACCASGCAGGTDPWEYVALASQQPVLFEGTLRSNILLGRPLVESAYRRVVSACALEPDFISLGGDLVAVDAGGHCLSGKDLKYQGLP